MLSVISLAVVVVGVSIWSILENRRMDKRAEENSDRVRSLVLSEIDRAGMSVSDFPDQQDALEGQRALTVKEVIHITMEARSHGRRTDRGGDW